MAEPYLRLLQTVSPEVDRGGRQAGSILFPNGYVVPPRGAFEATVIGAEHFWSEFLRRELGGGFLGIYTYADRPPPKDETECVRTTRLTLQTDQGEVYLSLMGQQRLRMLSLIIRADLLERRFKFFAEDLTVRTGGELVGQAWFWRWELI